MTGSEIDEELEAVLMEIEATLGEVWPADSIVAAFRASEFPPDEAVAAATFSPTVSLPRSSWRFNRQHAARCCPRMRTA